MLAVDMDLTQRTLGRLLAALSFNNRYPSPSSSSPSISSVSQVCEFTVCFGPSVFPSLFLCLFPLFHMLSPSSETHLRLPYLISLASEALFHLPLQPGFDSLIQCHPFPLSLLRFSLPRNPLVQSTANDSIKLTICCQRDSGPHTSDLFIHALFHAIQIKSEKNSKWHQLNSLNTLNT